MSSATIAAIRTELYAWLRPLTFAPHRFRTASSMVTQAKWHLTTTYRNMASTRDRGCLLPAQLEALEILERAERQTVPHTLVRL